MLSKPNRLQKDRDFSKVFRKSRPTNVGLIDVRAVKTGNNTKSRFGFVISNKIDKRATQRNALKRRLRSIVRDLLPEIKPGFNVVVVVKQNYPLPYDSKAISNDIRDAFKKINLI